MSEIINIPFCTISKNSLIIDERATKEQWDQIGITLKTMEKSVQFWIGDWLRYGEKKWGEMYKEAEEITGLENQTLRNIKSISENIELSRRRDNLGFSHHAEVASLKPEQQSTILDLAEEENLSVREVREKVKEIKRGEVKKCKLPDNKYRVIYADPPWFYGNMQHSKEEQETTIDSHYPMMKLEEICAMSIKDITENSAVLFLWTTSPKLFEAKEVIEAWGFEYKASMVWDKVKHNVGYYVSVRHEFLLIATKGSCLPEVKKLYDSVYMEERTEHSKKPKYFIDLIDELYPNGKRIELFCRNPKKGWDVYGNQL